MKLIIWYSMLAFINNFIKLFNTIKKYVYNIIDLIFKVIMAKIDTFKVTVDQLVEGLGGIDNIKSAFNCATRFRVIVYDDARVDKKKLEKVEKSKGFSKEGEQWQIIFGAGVVNKVYDKYIDIYKKTSSLSNNDNFVSKKIKWNKNYSFKTNSFIYLRTGIRSFADIFIPLIPLFIAGGLSLAINSLISVDGIGKHNGEWLNGAAQVFSKIFDTIGGAILGSLPVFIGYTSAKKWGGSGWLGAAMGLILIAPGLINSYTLNAKEINWYSIFGATPESVDGVANIPVLWEGSPRIFDIKYPVFGIPLMGYQAQIIPTLLVIAIAVQIEKIMKKVSHESFAIISVPLVTVVVTTVLAFAIIGPLGYTVSLAIAEALRAMFVYTNFPGFGIGGAILGAVYAPIVVTGLHQGFLPIETQLLTTYGESWITPIACVSNVSQAFACLAASMYIKDKSKKSVAYSGGISANLGITEPALFGININIKHIFLAGIIGSAVGGYWLGMTQTPANSVGSASWIGLIQFDVTTQSDNIIKWYENVANATPWGKYMTSFGLPPIANAAIAMTMSSLVAFIMVNVLSLTKRGQNILKEYNGSIYSMKILSPLIERLNKQKKNKKVKEYYIYAPMNGELFIAGKTGDAVFDSEMMGKSFAIKSIKQEYDLYAPFKGKIQNIFDTGHAITITNKKGNSILIHIGLDSAQLNLGAENIRKLKFIKFHKFILSNVSKPKKIKKPIFNNLLRIFAYKIYNSSSKIAHVENYNLIKNGAKDDKVFFSLLSETIKSNQKIEFIKVEGYVSKGEPIIKVITV